MDLYFGITLKPKEKSHFLPNDHNEGSKAVDQENSNNDYPIIESPGAEFEKQKRKNDPAHPYFLSLTYMDKFEQFLVNYYSNIKQNKGSRRARRLVLKFR